MNCVKCGHDVIKHFLPGSLCSGCERNNGCRLSRREIIERVKDIELSAWKAEALAAREYINKVDEFLAGLRIDIQYVLPDETSIYLAAKVKDTQP